jgi:hypothetical protein
MDVASEIDFLDRAIASQHSAIRTYSALALGAIVLAPLVAFIPNLIGMSKADIPKLATLLSAVLTASSASFPVKEIYGRREAMNALRFLRSRFERYQSALADSAEVEKDRQRLWQLVDKKLGG